MKRLTSEDLVRLKQKRGYGIFSSIGGCPIQRERVTPIVERHLSDVPLEAPQVQGEDTGKYLVRITSFSVRLLDEDNLCEKFHVDCCRYAGLLPADSPDKARIETRQEKVGSAAEERTDIEIIKM